MERFEHRPITRFIQIDKDKIPYKFELENFIFTIKYNKFADRFYMMLKNKNGEVLGIGEEKLVLDFPLFWIYAEDFNGNRNSNFPPFNLVPRSIDGKEYVVNWDNLGQKILLAYEEVNNNATV